NVARHTCSECVLTREGRENTRYRSARIPRTGTCCEKCVHGHSGPQGLPAHGASLPAVPGLAKSAKFVGVHVIVMWLIASNRNQCTDRVQYCRRFGPAIPAARRIRESFRRFNFLDTSDRASRSKILVVEPHAFRAFLLIARNACIEPPGRRALVQWPRPWLQRPASRNSRGKARMHASVNGTFTRTRNGSHVA